jgi:hypothetical protein
MNDESTEFRCLFADDPRGIPIHRLGGDLIALGFVYRSVGGGVDDDIWANFTDGCANGLGIGEVESRTVKRDDLAKRSKRALKLKANLAIAASEEDCGSHGRHKKKD